MKVGIRERVEILRQEIAEIQKLNLAYLQMPRPDVVAMNDHARREQKIARDRGRIRLYDRLEETLTYAPAVIAQPPDVFALPPCSQRYFPLGLIRSRDLDSFSETLIGFGKKKKVLLANSLCRVQEKRTMRGENFVPCLLLIIFLAFPRIALALLFLFSNYLQRAYHGLILPVLGFLFLPLTTLAYAWMANTRQPIAGINLLILIVAVVIDLGGLSQRRISSTEDDGMTSS